MTASKDENSYKNILKGTSIFGSVQLLQILINLVRGKFVAMFLGPEGMGINTLFNSSANTIQQFSSLGLNLAIVKEVSTRRDNKENLKLIVLTARRLLLFTGLLGALVCALFSRTLSELTFGNQDYTWQFVLLSVMVFFAIQSAGELSLLQGIHDVKRLSRASFVGALTGLLIGVPLYWLFGNKGIVPAMIALSFTMFIFYRISVRKNIKASGGKVFSWKEHKSLVRTLIMLGVVLMASNVIGTSCGYLINLFVRSFGNLSDVGFFQASNSLTNQCMSVVFSAISLDFFPRLTAIASDNEKMKTVVNRQIEVIAYITAPILCALIIAAPLIVKVLLTDSFEVIVPLLRWMALGTVLKALSFPMGYISFAKDNKRLFFWLEGILGNLLWLSLSCIFYYWFGLIGLGISMVVDFSICLIIYFIVNNHKYEFNYSRRSLSLSIFAALAVGSVFLLSSLTSGLLFYCGSILLFLIIAIFSIRGILKIWKTK